MTCFDIAAMKQKIRTSLPAWVGLILLGWLLAACGTGDGTLPAQQPVLTPTELGIVITAPEVTLAPPPTAQPTPAPAESATVTTTPAATSTPLPATQSPTEPVRWTRHTSARWGLSFNVPADWQKVGEDHFRGKDGFVQLVPFTGPAISLAQAVAWEANVYRERYGQDPVLFCVTQSELENLLSYPCLILGGRGAIESAILSHSWAGNGERRLVLFRVDTAHAEAIARSLDYHPAATPQPDGFYDIMYPEAIPTEDIPPGLSSRAMRWGANSPWKNTLF